MNLRRAAILLATCLVATSPPLFAAADGSRLQLPEGAQVGIVVFEDLQCPDCARAHPELLRVAASEKVPVVIRDFPITRHAWAFPAAVLARWFGTQSPALEVEFRSAVFHQQPDIRPENLREFGEKFAAKHNLQLPADVDPDGRLAAAVQADFDFGREIGLEYVPLVFVVGRGNDAPHWVEVTELEKLPTAIADMRKATQR
jgi:protein-disulfide isomerase